MGTTTDTLMDTENWDTWKADYQGTCALCLESVYPGQRVVPMSVSMFGHQHRRNVHVLCAEQIIRSTADGGDLRLAQEISDNVYKAS